MRTNLKETIEKIKEMDAKERRKRIWMLVGVVFAITLIMGILFK